MSVFQQTYPDPDNPKSGKRVKASVWWYEFTFAGRRIRESAKTTRVTLAREAEKNRRLELERGYNAVEDNRAERVRSINELADVYLESYKLRHKSYTFAQYALEKVKAQLGRTMAIDVGDGTVKEYQSARLKQKASPKTINEEVGFLLRILDAEQSAAIRLKLRRQKALRLAGGREIAKAYSEEEKAALVAEAKKRRTPAMYTALMLGLHAGLRDSEILGLQWDRLRLDKRYLVVGESKSEAGEGRTIPLNVELFQALLDHAKWYVGKFGQTRPEWYVFPYGKPQPTDPTRPMQTLKTAWSIVRKKAGVSGRWHDTRHTFVTNLAESGEAGDETIRSMAGHVSTRMLRHYSHIGMEAKRRAVASLNRRPEAVTDAPEITQTIPIPNGADIESAEVDRLN